jgi:acyl-CoA synthetase (NDP forming)
VADLLAMPSARRLNGVNPGRQEVLGHRCVPRIAELPDNVEAAIVILPAAAAVNAVEECAAKGIRAVVVGASGFGETGEEGKRLEQRLREVAEREGLALVGPNSDGVVNFHTGQTLSYQPVLLRDIPIRRGGVTVISHSGAMTSAIISHFVDLGIGMNAAVACGNQTVLAMEDYLRYFALDAATDTVVLFVEAIRRSDEMREALTACRQAEKWVVVLKIGASRGGELAAASHTGAVAGSYQNSIRLLREARSDLC